MFSDSSDKCIYFMELYSHNLIPLNLLFKGEKYMDKEEFEVQEHIPFEGNEGIFARGDVSINKKFKTGK